jgi:hypothetical protein
LELPAASVALHVTVFDPTANVEPDEGTQTLVTPGQLSEPVGSGNVTVVSVPVAQTCTLLGQVIVGVSMSRMITWNVQLLLLPAPSVAVQVTLLVPLLNVEPEGGTQLVVATEQLSVALALYVTLLRAQRPTSVFSVRLVGQVTVGGSVSLMVTVNEQVFVLLPASTAVHVTRLVPTLKVEPEAGEQFVVTPGQLSLAVAANVTLLFEQ